MKKPASIMDDLQYIIIRFCSITCRW